MKNIIITVIVLALVGYGIFVYVTRPLEAPTSQTTNVLPGSTTVDTKTLGKRYVISQTDSRAEFSLNEVLNGKPNLVVGTTDQINGDMNIKLDAPAQITINEVKVNARTLKTDNEKRNASIGRMILKSEDAENEFITFKTTKVKGVPNKIETGKEFPYYIAGELTIKGVTKLVIFQATGSLQADGSFKSSASTTINYADYGISVPSIPFVAKVDKSTKLTISIVAK